MAPPNNYTSDTELAPNHYTSDTEF
jgi:hypothetical protein